MAAKQLLKKRKSSSFGEQGTHVYNGGKWLQRICLFSIFFAPYTLQIRKAEAPGYIKRSADFP